MNSLFATSARTMRRVVLVTVLALSFALLMLTGAAHTAHAACNSLLTSVTNFNTSAHQTVYISGQCLGTNNATAKNTYYLDIRVFNGTQYWDACFGNDGVTCSIQYWGQNEIVFNGFAGYYGLGPYVLRFNQVIAIYERNPQNPLQWSKCTLYVGYASKCLNQLATSYQGTGYNINYNETANLALTSIQENQQGNISGYAQWSAPLDGSGPFTGQVYDNGQVIFTSTANDGSGVTITFSGQVNPYGFISGNYTVNNGQRGTWEVNPA